MTDPTASVPGPAEISSLQSDINELTGLFARRLLSDRNAADREARILNLLEGRFLEGFLNRVRLLMDRLAAETEQAGHDGDDEYGFAQSVYDELREALAELDVEVIDEVGPFDPTRHVAVVRDTGDVGEPSVSLVVSVGIAHRSRTMIPAEAVITVPSTPAGT